MIHRKAMSLMSTAEAIATTAAAALSQATSQQTSPTGSTVTHNADGTKTISGSVLGTDSTGASVTTATHVGDTTPPGIPTGITAWSGDGAVHVSWDGTLEGGIPADFCQVNLLVGGTRVAQLAKAGSTTYLDVAVGTTVSVTATSEDDACDLDGTAAHNVSAACTAISVTVTDTAATTAQHFWADDSGAHISSTGDHDSSGFHQLMTSVKNAFMHGTTELMTISENLIELGKNSITATIKMCADHLRIYGESSSGFGSMYVVADKDPVDATTEIASSYIGFGLKNFGAGTDDYAGISLQYLRSMSGKPAYSRLNLFSHVYNVGGTEIGEGRFLTAIQPVVLYNGGAALDYDTAPGAGTNGDVTLSETAANFKRMKILYRTSDSSYQSCEVVSPNGRFASLHAVDSYNDVSSANIKTANVLISGESITVQNAVEVDITTSLVSGGAVVNHIYVVRVEGRR